LKYFGFDYDPSNEIDLEYLLEDDNFVEEYDLNIDDADLETDIKPFQFPPLPHDCFSLLSPPYSISDLSKDQTAIYSIPLNDTYLILNNIFKECLETRSRQFERFIPLFEIIVSGDQLGKMYICSPILEQFRSIPSIYVSKIGLDNAHANYQMNTKLNDARLSFYTDNYLSGDWYDYFVQNQNQNQNQK
jgi:hypothetical protein